VREAYLDIIRREPERFRIVDASLSVEEIHSKLSEIIAECLENRK
jgi:thymidylate kinase